MRGKMRAGLSLLLCLVLCLGAAGAAGNRDLTGQEGQAMRLEDLGLFRGVGVDENGFTDFDLDRSPSREEAVTMLVRALGKESEAAGMEEKTHPFADVPAWADGYVSYAWENGLTKGVSDTAFGAGETATGAMYVTFMLRALGYADGTDFTWDDPWDLAEDCGLLPERVDRVNFLRADAVDVTAAALSAKRAGTDTTLADYLIAQGAFSQEDFDRAFQTYEAAMAGLTEGVMPFVIEERWDSSYGTVLLGQYVGTPHAASPALRLVTKPAFSQGEGLTIQLPLARTGFFSSAQPDQISLSEDGRTLTYSCTVPADALGTDGVTVLQEKGTYTYTVDLSTGEVSEAFQAAPAPTPEAEQAAYEAAIAQCTQGVTVLERLESDPCTILYTAAGASGDEGRSLTLVYKPGSARGAGETVNVSLPQISDTAQAAPEGLALSADGKSLTFTCTVGASSTGQEPGTYQYTISLDTGSIGFEITP